MAFTDVIKYEGKNDVLVWKHPKVDFNYGSQIIVHESQQAVFYNNGEILKVYGPGRHVIETENMPVAKGLFKVASGFRNTFHAEVYFVNLVEKMALKWGTDSKISYIDPEYNFPVEVGLCGEMQLSISNSSKFLVKLVGTEKKLEEDTLLRYFRAFLMNRIKSIFPSVVIEKSVNIFSIDQCFAELSEIIQIELKDDFFDYGIDLRQFLITRILRPDEDRNFVKFRELHYRRYTDVAEAELNQKINIINQQTRAQQIVIEAEALAQKRKLENYTYQQEKGFNVAMEMARNEAVGEMNNLGIGLGLMAGIGGEVGRYVGNMTGDALKTTAEPAKRARFCGNCGYAFINDSNFCPECGSKRGE